MYKEELGGNMFSVLISALVSLFLQGDFFAIMSSPSDSESVSKIPIFFDNIGFFLSFFKSFSRFVVTKKSYFKILQFIKNKTRTQIEPTKSLPEKISAINLVQS